MSVPEQRDLTASDREVSLRLVPFQIVTTVLLSVMLLFFTFSTLCFPMSPQVEWSQFQIVAVGILMCGCCAEKEED